jgi:NDP-sugar pyrophosphorylase family protein
MREVRFRDLVNEDFLVMYADTIINADLSKIVGLHFDKKTELRNVVLTTTMRKGHSPELLILNSSTSEILQV